MKYLFFDFVNFVSNVGCNLYDNKNFVDYF